MLQRYDQNQNQHPILRLQNEFNQIMNRFFNEPLFAQPSSFMPAINVKEEENRYVVEAELPGMEMQDVDIEVHGNVLTIKGERKSRETKEGDRTHIIESRYGAFHRSLTLPEHVDTQKITAESEKGVLTIYIPKDDTERPRKIEVKKIQ